MTQEVWLLWETENILFESIETLLQIFSNKEIAEKHKKELEDKETERKLDQWREVWDKKPTEFPDGDLKPDWEYYVQSWDVSTE